MRVAKVVLPFGYKCFDDELANSLSDKHMAEVYKIWPWRSSQR